MCLVLDSQLFDGHRKYDVFHVTKSLNYSKHLLHFKKITSANISNAWTRNEWKSFFQPRIPNNFTITPINFGLEGIVYPLLLCLDQNSDGLLTNFFWASVWEEKRTSISVRFATQIAEAKFSACAGFISSS